MTVETNVALPPLYARPPIHYAGVRVLVVLLPSPLPVDLPAGLSSGTMGGAIMVADYPQSDLGPYREVFGLTSARYAGEPVWFCPLIYVTSDAALAAGREIWGFPKKLAEIDVTVDGDSSFTAELSRGTARLSIAASLQVDLDPQILQANDAAIVNLRTVPSVDGSAPDDHALTSVSLDLTIARARGGTATLTTVSSDDDPFATLFSAEVNCAASYMQGDSVLPYGRVLTHGS